MIVKNILVVCESFDLTNGGSIGQTKRIMIGLKKKFNFILFTTKLSKKLDKDLNGIKIYEFPTGPALGAQIQIYYKHSKNSNKGDI
jgi:hypothetical protein